MCSDWPAGESRLGNPAGHTAGHDVIEIQPAPRLGPAARGSGDAVAVQLDTETLRQLALATIQQILTTPTRKVQYAPTTAFSPSIRPASWR